MIFIVSKSLILITRSRRVQNQAKGSFNRRLRHVKTVETLKRARATRLVEHLSREEKLSNMLTQISAQVILLSGLVFLY